MTVQLGFAPSENPLVLREGGFYRRWLRMLDDHAELQAAVDRLEGTVQDLWVPVWGEVGTRREFLIAKTYCAIGRFPGEVSEVERSISRDCARAHPRACAFKHFPASFTWPAGHLGSLQKRN